MVIQKIQRTLFYIRFLELIARLKTCLQNLAGRQIPDFRAHDSLALLHARKAGFQHFVGLVIPDERGTFFQIRVCKHVDK